MKMNQSKFLIILLLLILPLTAYGEQITLINGDVINGSLISADDDTVVWRSTVFGEISIPRNQVASLPGSDQDQDQEQPSSSKLMESAGATGLSGQSFLSDFFSSINLSGNVNLSVNTKSGNVNQDNYRLQSDLSWENQVREHKLDLSYNFETSEDETVTDDFEVLYQLNWLLGEKWFANTNINYLQDDFRDIDSRLRIGLGAGYRFWDTAYSSLSSNFGFHYFVETLNNVEDQEGMGWRFSTEFDYSFIDSSLEIFYTHHIYGSFEETKDIDSSLSIGTRYRLSTLLTTSISLDWDYDNLPVAGNVKSDKRLNMSVGYSW